MKLWIKAMTFSLIAHVVVAGGIATVSRYEGRPMNPKAPVLIDFTVNPSFGDGVKNTRISGVSPATERPETDISGVTETRYGQIKPMAKKMSCKKHAGCRKKCPVHEGIHHASGPAALSSGGLPGGGNIAEKTREGKSSGNGLDTGIAAMNSEERYLREHFGYIRDLVRKKLRYPRAAISMGQEGKVGVSFTVHENGELSDLEVSKSSGSRLLDIDAVDTVARAAPFPPPPVTARIVIPVEYILE